MFKSLFYLVNTLFAIFYLYPGSILGFIIYKDLNRQPQLTDDFNLLLLNFSSNHVYAFFIVSLLGFVSNTNKKIYTAYFIILSIFLELSHIIIPNRSFQFGDLFGNILGVLISIIIIKIYYYLERK